VFDRHFPDKAIDVLDMSCVRCKNSNEKILKKEYIVDVIENNYNVKIQVNDKAKALKNSLNEILLGQESAIEDLCNHIRYIELGMNDYNKPLGVFLFVGPTGVGKTESAKQVAKHYFGSDSKCIKLDMSEYSEASSVSKLIGSPPGYVGYEKQSLLVDHIRNNPYSVVILDEVEKAHRDILDVFLNVFDEGYFFDSNKKKIEFTNSIIIMTSNLGFSEEMFHKGKVGFVNNKVSNNDVNKVIEKHFRPEFINRIDEIIIFENLSKDTCEKLITRYINEYQSKIATEINSDIIIKSILSDVQILRYGARGIKRKVKKEILKQLDTLKVYKT
jgi:ATP-dependent Clp protease ATP-binding subunit ClpA